MNVLTNAGFFPALVGLALFGALSGMTNAEVPRLDAMRIEHIETATFSLG